MAQITYKTLIQIALGALICIGSMWRCASVGTPMGGPRDSLAPRVVNMIPKYGTTSFVEKRIFIEFDEYVAIKDQQKEFYVSPFMERQPTLTLRGRGVQIDFRDTLLKDQTYSLNFCSSIRDNNEGNPLNDFRYVFSTGTSVDSMLMSGYAVDGYTRDSASKAYILFYPAEMDSIPHYDSLMFRAPAAVARAQNNGIFIAENLKPINYRIYALDDRNGNRTYEPGVDRVAFLDSIYNPVSMPDFTIRYDTARKYNVADPQLYFRMFMDEGFKRQYLISSTRPVQHQLLFVFGAKYPQITSFHLNGIDSTRIITQYLKPTRDSVCYWLNVPSAELPDTIKGEITYMKHDSLNVLQSVTQKLALGWKSFETKKNKNDTMPPINPFKYKVDAAQTLNPFNNIAFTFEFPLIAMDSSLVTLTRVEGDDKKYRTRLRMVQDTTDMLRWTLIAPWTAESKYELVIPAATFTNIAGQQNDTLKANFTVAPPDKFAVLDLTVKGKTPQSEYVVQIIDQGGRVLRELTHVRSGKITIPYLEPGMVRIRVIEDMSGNGKWDGGNLIKRMQSERAEIFVTEKGDPDVTTKENWTLDFTLDMPRMFAPMTMEAVIRQLKEMEIARVQKLLKQQAQQQSRTTNQQQRNSQNSSGAGNGMDNGMSGQMGGSMPAMDMF